MGGDKNCAGCDRQKHKECQSGRKVCSWCEEWRLETEARHVCRLKTIKERRAYLGGVVAKRGQQAGDYLMRRVAAVWEAMG